MPNIKKKNYVLNLCETLAAHPSFVIVDYDSVSHKALEDLRKQVKKIVGAHIMVVKNSLFKIAFSKVKAKHKFIDKKDEEAFCSQSLSGPSAVMFLSTEWLDVIKLFYEFTQKNEGASFKAGIIENTFYTKEMLTALAKLPSKPEIQVKLIKILRNKQYTLVYTLNFVPGRFVNVLKEISRNKN